MGNCCCQPDNQEETKDLDQSLMSFNRKESSNERTIPTMTNEEIVKEFINGFGQIMHNEQKIASSFIHLLIEYLGNPGQYILEIGINTKINQMRDTMGGDKLNKYLELRLEESEMEQKLSDQLKQVAERLFEIDAEKGKQINNELSLLDAMINDEHVLKQQLDLLKSKEDEYSAQKGANLGQTALRLVNRINIERELTSIKVQLSDTQATAVDPSKLREIDSLLSKVTKLVYNNLVTVSEENMQSNSSEIYKEELNDSYSQNFEQLLAKIESKIEVLSRMQGEIDNINEQNIAEHELNNFETDIKRFADEFNGARRNNLKILAKALGADEDVEFSYFPANEMKHRCGAYKAIAALKEKSSLFFTNLMDQDKVILDITDKVNEAQASLDTLNWKIEELIKQEIRDLSNSISSDQSELRDELDKIKAASNEVDNDPSLNLVKYIHQIVNKMKIMQEIEILRKLARENHSKEVSVLRNSFQFTLNQLETKRNSIESEHGQMFAKLKTLEENSEKDKVMLQKYSQLNSEQEIEISKLKNAMSTMAIDKQEKDEKILRLEDENQELEKSVMKNKKTLREKDNELRETADKLSTTEQETETLKSTIAQISSALDSKAKLLSTLESDTKTLSSQLEQSNQNNSSLLSANDKLQSEIERLTELINRKDAEVEVI